MARPKSDIRLIVEAIQPGTFVDHPAGHAPLYTLQRFCRAIWEVSKANGGWYTTRRHGDVVQIARVL